MMSVLEYATDVNKTVEEILKLCKKLDINCNNEDDMLSEDDIILLDNEISIDEDIKEFEEIIEEEILDDDELEKDLRINTVEDKSVVKMKKKDTPIKKDDNSKYLKAKKNIYKHKEKLASNENDDDDSVILYKNNMTVKDLADELKISASELVKKLFDLGVLTTLNQSLDFSTAEVIVLDYGKELKKEETRDIANFEEYEIIDKEEDLVSRIASSS